MYLKHGEMQTTQKNGATRTFSTFATCGLLRAFDLSSGTLPTGNLFTTRIPQHTAIPIYTHETRVPVPIQPAVNSRQLCRRRRRRRRRRLRHHE